MLVTPAKKSFGKYKPGDVFELRDKAAEAMIKIGKLKQAAAPSEPASYTTRELRATPSSAAEPAAPIVTDESAVEAAPAEAEPAPYGYKADGTPRKRPGRTASDN